MKRVAPVLTYEALLIAEAMRIANSVRPATYTEQGNRYGCPIFQYDLGGPSVGLVDNNRVVRVDFSHTMTSATVEWSDEKFEHHSAVAKTTKSFLTTFTQALREAVAGRDLNAERAKLIKKPFYKTGASEFTPAMERDSYEFHRIDTAKALVINLLLDKGATIDFRYKNKRLTGRFQQVTRSVRRVFASDDQVVFNIGIHAGGLRYAVPLIWVDAPFIA